MPTVGARTRVADDTYLILYSYFTHTLLILYSYFTHTLLILYSYVYCEQWVRGRGLQMILNSYFTHTVLILYSYFTDTYTASSGCSDAGCR